MKGNGPFGTRLVLLASSFEGKPKMWLSNHFRIRSLDFRLNSSAKRIYLIMLSLRSAPNSNQEGIIEGNFKLDD